MQNRLNWGFTFPRACILYAVDNFTEFDREEPQQRGRVSEFRNAGNAMKLDPYGVSSRWSGAARRGTLTNLGWALGALILIAFALSQLAG